MKSEELRVKNWLTRFTCVSLFFILHFSFFNPNSVQAQWWTGWSQQTGLALCLHQTNSGYELYSPLQTSDPIPVSKWSFQNDTLRLECASIGLKMTLKSTPLPPSRRGDEEVVPDGATVWNGTWRQGLLKETITLQPADTLYQLRRPQTPQLPYRFDEETVSVDYTDSQGNEVHLEGTLTFPREGTSRHYPCIVLVSGSGQQNRDEELFFHKPFLVLADYLASRGIAVLRYDDRGVGASTGVLDSANTYLFAEDAEAMFNALKNNPHVDLDRLGIGGHSEGGAIAPLVASRNKDVKFVLMLAGQGCTGLDVLLQQNEALFRSAGVSPQLVAIRVACSRDLFGMPAGSTQKDYQTVINRHTEGLTKEQIDSIGLKKGAAYTIMQQLDSRWMRSFLTLDPADYFPKVKCPVLALNGSKDCQVLSHPNLDRIAVLCPQAECHELPNLNHLFQRCETGNPDEYIRIEETFAPEAMKTIADWILGGKR